MDFHGAAFPGISTPSTETQSMRSYSYDPMGSLSQQQTNYNEVIGPAADNMTNLTVFKAQLGDIGDPNVPQVHPGGFIGNIQLTKPAFFSNVGWWGASGVGGICNNWDDLRQQGVGYGLYSPHLPMHPVPANKLFEPGSGFVLPATFLGQPLVAMAQPPGS